MLATEGSLQLIRTEERRSMYSALPAKNPLTLKGNQLKPQVSVLLYDLRLSPLPVAEFFDMVESETPRLIERVYARRADSGSRLPPAAGGLLAEGRLVIGVVARETRGDWTLGGHWHAVRTSPQWMKQLDSQSSPGDAVGGLEDVHHHLTLLLVRAPRPSRAARFAALVSTDATVRSQISNLLDTQNLERVPRELLAQAFLRGASRQAWLRGIHRPTRVKADTKALAGLDLREAIDPFGDQTFRLDAAVSDPRAEQSISDFRASLPEGSRLRGLDPREALGQPPTGSGTGLVGLSLRSGLVWTRNTQGINDLLRELDALCNQVERVREAAFAPDAAHDQKGYEVLARPQRAVDLTVLGEASDFSCSAVPTFDVEGEGAPHPVAEAQREWLETGIFKVLRNEGERLFVSARLGERHIATLRIQPVLHADDRAELVTTAERASDVAPDDEAWLNLDYTLDRLQSRATVWFSEGFTIQSGRVFSLKYRDVPFDRWRWLPFSSSKEGGPCYEVSEEKPADSGLWNVAWDGRSLFEFVVNNAASLFSPAGEWHLLCDDGSGEIADFVYIEPGAKRLYLVHIKAAEASQRRGIAPAMYEVVVSQATKNMRFLDPGILAERLQSQAGGSRVEELTWRSDGRRLPNREQAIRALTGMGQYLERTVVVLQPHTTRNAWKAAERKLKEGTLSGRDRVQLLRLRTLLADLEDVCRRFDARFEAWGENDGGDKDVAFTRSALR